MIYLFHGSDVAKVRTKAFEWIAKARAKEPNLVYVRLARDEVSRAVLEDITQSGGLFVHRLLVLIDGASSETKTVHEDAVAIEEGTVSADVIEDSLDALADSDNAIVFLAPKLAFAKAKKIIAKAKVEYIYNAPATREVTRGFNTGLVSALGARNKEKLWVEINRALRAGDAPEMLHGLLHWKARDLMEKGSRAWTPRESRALSLSLISLLQESRRGGLDLSRALERFALSI